MSFSVNYSHTESVSKPLYLPGTDINVDEAVEQEREKLKSQGASEEEANIYLMLGLLPPNSRHKTSMLNRMVRKR